MGICRLHCPEKMICPLINYYWVFYLKKKILLHWNKCQGMAREFILFTRICHWIGWKVTVLLKTFSCLSTEWHRGAMPAFPEWEGNGYSSKSKQIFIPLHHPDTPDSKEWLGVPVCAFYVLNLPIPMKTLLPVGWKLLIHFPKDFQGLLNKS